MARDDFVKRVLFELSTRRWSRSQLARAAGLNQVTVIEICNRTRMPGERARSAIADALGWPGEPEELLEDVRS